MRVRVCTGTSHRAGWAIIISISGLLGCATTPTSYDQVGQWDVHAAAPGGVGNQALDEVSRWEQTAQHGLEMGPVQQ